MKQRRSSGILLSATSLPGQFGIGDIGPAADLFIDFLQSAGQRLWQLLPIHPTMLERDNSPYGAESFYAGNPLLISIADLIEQGLLPQEAAASSPRRSVHRVDYAAVRRHRESIWPEVFDRWPTIGMNHAMEEYCESNKHWLDEYALFVILRRLHGGQPWTDWPVRFRRRQGRALRKARRDFAEQIRQVCIVQFIFDRQWRRLRRRCNSRGIRLIGDLPLYPSHDSADVWARPELFELDREFRMTATAGSPPDLFNTAGQSWNVPIYRWEAVMDDDCRWWIERLQRMLDLFDLVRWDHFQAVSSEWQMIPGQAPKLGQLVPGPGRAFMDTLHRHFGMLPVIPEVIARLTPELNELMHFYELPQMRLLQLSFDGDPALNPHATCNYDTSNIVAYTGTHDLPPIRGWWTRISAEQRGRVERFVGHHVDEQSAAWNLIRLTSASIADLAVFQMQDVLNLPGGSQMNYPGTSSGNWTWRCSREQLTPELADRLAETTTIYSRR